MADVDPSKLDAGDNDDVEVNKLNIDDDAYDEAEGIEGRADDGGDVDLEPLAAHNRTSDNPEMNMSEQPRSFDPTTADDDDIHDDDAPKAPPSKLSTEKQLDHGLKETFPASDPVSINPGAD